MCVVALWPFFPSPLEESSFRRRAFFRRRRQEEKDLRSKKPRVAFPHSCPSIIHRDETKFPPHAYFAFQVRKKRTVSFEKKEVFALVFVPSLSLSLPSDRRFSSKRKAFSLMSPTVAFSPPPLPLPRKSFVIHREGGLGGREGRNEDVSVGRVS